MTAAALRSSGLVLSKTSFQPLYPSTKTSHHERVKRLRRTVLNTWNLLSNRYDSGAYYWVMVTLTYAPGIPWNAKHISGYMASIRKHLKDHHKITKLHYFWVMELQKRGAPHYHVAIRLRHGVRVPMPDLSGMWCIGWSNVTKAKHAGGYMSKYLSKGTTIWEIGCIPKGARLHGASNLDTHEMHIRRWWNLPRWVRDVLGTIQPVKRVSGGFADKNGEFLPTPYIVDFEGGMLRISLNLQIIEEYGYELSS